MKGERKVYHFYFIKTAYKNQVSASTTLPGISWPEYSCKRGWVLELLLHILVNTIRVCLELVLTLTGKERDLISRLDFDIYISLFSVAMKKYVKVGNL